MKLRAMRRNAVVWKVKARDAYTDAKIVVIYVRFHALRKVLRKYNK